MHALMRRCHSAWHKKTLAQQATREHTERHATTNWVVNGMGHCARHARRRMPRLALLRQPFTKDSGADAATHTYYVALVPALRRSRL